MSRSAISIFIASIFAFGSFYVVKAAAPATTQFAPQTDDHMPLVFSGGYDTDPRDRGRPVVLVANGLGVTPDVFRDAFSGVHPAGPNSGGPTPDEARANKRVLLDKLSKYGVTNDRLDEVSNYYRYRRSNNEMWKHHDAAGYAIVKQGKVVSVTITDAGAGYCVPPTVTVDSLPTAHLTATLLLCTDLKTNGSIQSVTVDSAPSTVPGDATPKP